MQVMFSMGMEEALEEVQELRRRVAYQDDTNFFATASLLESAWPSLTAALAKCGHRMRPQKCKFWAPLCDTPADPPPAVQCLAHLIPRDFMLGSAA